jgi:hypothetical protein
VEIDPDVRQANRRVLRHLGFGRVPDDVGPAPAGPPRPAGEVVERALALHVVVQVAGGLDGDVAGRWLDALDVRHALAPGEIEYLDDAAEGLRVEDAARALGAEALAVLLWALGLLDDLPLEGPATGATSVLPGPGGAVGAAALAAELRPVEELWAAHDLVAGMAWALRADPDLEVGAAPGSLDPYVVRRRLGALHWLLGGERPL